MFIIVLLFLNYLLKNSGNTIRRRFSAVIHKKSTLYLPMNLCDSIKSSYDYMRSTHLNLLRYICNKSYKNYMPRQPLREFSQITFSKLYHFFPGNTMAVREYFKLLDLYLQSICWIIENLDNTSQSRFFDVVEKKFSHVFLTLKNDFDGVLRCFEAVCHDIQHPRDNGSFENSEFNTFIRSFFEHYFSSLTITPNFNSTEQILIITRSFYTLFADYTGRLDKFHHWFDGMCDEFKMSSSLSDFLIVDAILTHNVLELKEMYVQICREFCSKQFFFAMARAVDQPKLPKLKEESSKGDDT